MLENSSFYQLLQDPKLDKRDNRGKRHSLAPILFGVIMSVVTGRDHSTASLYRYLQNNHKKICAALDLPDCPVISRAQLPLVLAKVDKKCFAQLCQKHFGQKAKLEAFFRDWYAGDGKELCGTIEQGQKRGVAIVQVVSQKDQQIIAQDFYQGNKESEIVSMRDLLADLGLKDSGISLDALHCNPETLSAIESSRNAYVVGLKGNQSVLLTEMVSESLVSEPYCSLETTEVGHGRKERRQYQVFDISEVEIDARWSSCNVSSLLVVDRLREEIKSGKVSNERSYYLSNLGYQDNQEASELFDAIRGHWSVESVNWTRDVCLGEDAHRSGKFEVSAVLAICRSIGLNLLRALKPKSLMGKIDEFKDNIRSLLNACKTVNLL